MSGILAVVAMAFIVGLIFILIDIFAPDDEDKEG
jgi:hypothetical protein